MRNRWWADPLAYAELFALNNVAFLAVDIAIAHAINAFAHPAEWVPVAFSVVASAVLLLSMLLGGLRPTLPAADAEGRLGTRQRHARRLGMAVGWGSVAVGVGVLGFYFHVRANLAYPAASLTERFLYGAPAFAPLLFADLALLALLAFWALTRVPGEGQAAGSFD